MRKSLSSSSSTASPSQKKQKFRKWTREQLLKNLEILGPLSPPLPPDLPPSPPASRSSSPVPTTTKRKFEPSSDAQYSKRPRTSVIPDRSSHHHQPPTIPPPQHHFRAPNPVFSMRSEPSEDGEVPEEIATASSSRGPAAAAVVTSLVPVRRPRRGRPEYRTFDQMHDKYHQFGRLLKYSGDARFWSTYPASHKEYRPLLNPPPPNSPYHRFGGQIARLELVDALVCFTYSIWNRDYGRRQCARDTWGTIEAFLSWCKHKWQAEDTVGNREKAFIGLIWMIEAFIHGRKQSYIAKSLDPDMDKMLSEIKVLAAAAAAEVDKPSAGSSSQLVPGSQPTPPMLPSPASIAPASSANSTPINRANGTPSTASNSSSTSATRGQTSTLPSSANAPMSEAAAAAAAGVTMPFGANMIQTIKDQSGGVVAATFCMGFSQQTLNLPIMARHFPTTFARMVHSSLGPGEEYEPDFEDEEGELFWPGQCVTGEGIGWVCLMGKAMIKEFGKEIGYRGLDGVVPKPKPEEQGPEMPVGTGPSPRQGQSVGSAPAPAAHVER